MRFIPLRHVCASSRPPSVPGLFRLGLPIAGLAGAVAAARADVYQYGVTRLLSYTQTSPAPPAEPEYWSLYAFTYVDTPGEILSATVAYSLPPEVVRTLTPATPTLHLFLSDYYTSAAAFDAAYPATTYSFSVDRGAGPEHGSVFVPADLFSPQVPQLTGDTFDRIRMLDTTVGFTGTINGFTPASGTDTASSNVSVVEYRAGADPTLVLSIDLAPGDTVFEIPVGLLLPETYYSIGVSYANAASTPGGGFGGATAVADFVRGTGAYFTTLPLSSGCGPADFNGDGAVNVADFLAFLQAYAVADPRADLTADASVNIADFLAFLGLYAAGC